MAKLPPALGRRSLDRERISAREHEQARRSQVLALVTDVFAKRGYQGATIDHLVAGGHTSMGGFYKLFTGKEDCFVQAFDQAVSEAEATVRESARDDLDWDERAIAGLRSVLQLASDRPLVARLIFLEAQTGGPDSVRRYNELLARISEALRIGRTRSTAAEDLPDSFEEAIVSGVVWLLQNRLARGEAIDVDDLYPQLAMMVLEPYIGRRAVDGSVSQT